MPMNKLSSAERARTLQLLCEGMSIRAVCRVTGASKNTVVKLLGTAGAALGAYQDEAFRDLTCKRVQVDEIWSFVYAKAKNVAKAKSAPEGAGDAWTWTAIDADTKLVFSLLVGDRTADTAFDFLSDVRTRIEGRFQLTSDGHRAYMVASQAAFGYDEVDFAQLVKIYGAPEKGRTPEARYSPSPCIGTETKVRLGNPDAAHISTSYVERQNLTMRMHMRRFTRLTNGFSKKIDNHVRALALHFFYYNFVRIHSTLRVTPAMAAGVTDRLFEMADLVAIVEAAEKKPGKRGPYKKRAA